MNPSPATIANSIIDELSQLDYQDEKLTFSLAKIRSQAKPLAKAEPIAYYCILGAISCLEKNLEEMHYNHKNAINLSGGMSSLALNNYATSLSKLGLFEKAYEYGLKALELDPINSLYLKDMINWSFRIGRIRGTYDYVCKYKNIAENKHVENEESFINILNFLENKNISDDNFSAIYCSVIDVINNNDTPILKPVFFLIENHQELSKLYINITIKEDNLNTSKLQYEIEKKIEQIKLPQHIKDTFIFGVFDNEIVEFLSENKDIIPITHESRKKINTTFPSALVDLRLEKDHDICDSQKLVAYIKTKDNPQVVLPTLYKMGSDWMYDLIMKSNNTFFVSVEYQ